jgi:hypothetical protein
MAGSLLTILGCGGGTNTPTVGPLAVVQLASGDGQISTVGTELPNPIIGKLLDANGIAVPGTTVNFVVTAGGGTVYASAVSSDSNGVVANRWTLGTLSGPQSVEIRTVNSAGNAISYGNFKATATAGAAASVQFFGGGGQTAFVNSLLPNPMIARVLDRYANPVQGVLVSFAASSGGSLSPTQATADLGGKATTLWTLGGIVGEQVITGSVAGLPAATATSNAKTRSGVPATFTLYAGDHQNILQYTAPSPLLVIIQDMLGKPIQYEQVTFKLEDGSSSVITSNSNGIASWPPATYVQPSTYCLKKTGVSTVIASLTNFSDIIFSITVMPSNYSYDGIYLLGGLPSGSAIFSGFPFTISNGSILTWDGTNDIGLSGNFDRATGSVNLNYTNVIEHWYLTGQLTVGANGHASGSGTWTHAYGSGNETGTWTAARFE